MADIPHAMHYDEMEAIRRRRLEHARALGWTDKDIDRAAQRARMAFTMNGMHSEPPFTDWQFVALAVLER
jgi:hypothetical protein